MNKLIMQLDTAIQWSQLIEAACVRLNLINKNRHIVLVHLDDQNFGPRTLRLSKGFYEGQKPIKVANWGK